MPRALLDGELRQTDGIGGATELLAPLSRVLDADLPQSPALVALCLTLEDGKYSRKVSFQLFKLLEDKNDNEPRWISSKSRQVQPLYINQQSSHNPALLDQKNWTMLYQETSRRDSGYSLANLYLGASLG
jgi:hypothetical protein